MKYKVILLDGDGVLIIPSGYGSAHAFEQAGLDIKLLQPFFHGPFLDCERGKLDLKEILARKLEEWGWEKTVDDFLQEWFEYERVVNNELIAYIQDLDKEKVLLGLATDQEKYRAEFIKKEMNFENYFDEFYFSCDVGYFKIKKEYWQKVFESLQKKIVGLQKQEVVFWDNDVKNVEAAKEFGFVGEIYKDFEDFRNKLIG